MRAVLFCPRSVESNTAIRAAQILWRSTIPPPDAYLGKFWVDSITHDEALLRFILDLQGVNRICMGTDYPFPLGDLEFGAFMESMNLNEQDQMQLFGGAALSWLGMEASDFD